MFDIANSRDFYGKLVADFDDLVAHPSSARHAMNCAITAHHLHDWVWVDYLKADEVTRNKMGIAKSKDQFVRWICTQSIWFEVIQELSNGSKHFNRNTSFDTEAVTGFGMGSYGEGNYGQPYLAVDLGTGRSLSIVHLVEVVIRFWRDFFDTYSPYGKNLPQPKHGLMDS